MIARRVDVWQSKKWMTKCVIIKEFPRRVVIRSTAEVFMLATYSDKRPLLVCAALIMMAALATALIGCAKPREGLITQV
jgi:hypothetical protein